MAKRIAIVLSQLKGASPAQRELEGSVVAELLMVHGLEVTLITDLTALDDEDTGVLCLEGIAGDIVIAQLDVRAVTHIGTLLSGEFTAGSDVRRRVTHSHQRDARSIIGDNRSPRTIYHIDLRSVNDGQRLFCGDRADS